MGKSTAATLLAQRGVTIVDTDILARQIVQPGEPALAEIQQAFGADILATDGSLRRDQLARRVFSDSAARKTLEAILHPRIRRLWQSQLAEWRSHVGKNPAQEGSALSPQERAGERARIFCVVIPLLFETNAQTEVDATICLACSLPTQHRRLASRGWTTEQIDQRISSQLPVEDKMSRADYVLWNEGSLEVLAAQIDRIVY
jgi:dephospho-CoA kinase